MQDHAGGFVHKEHAKAPTSTVSSSAALRARTEGRNGGARNRPPHDVRLPSVAPSYVPDGEDWLPEWVRGHVERESPVAEVVKDALERVTTTPDRATLLEVQLLLNELGRDPDHAKLIRTTVREASRGLFGEED